MRDGEQRWHGSRGNGHARAGCRWRHAYVHRRDIVITGNRNIRARAASGKHDIVDAAGNVDYRVWSTSCPGIVPNRKITGRDKKCE